MKINKGIIILGCSIPLIILVLFLFFKKDDSRAFAHDLLAQVDIHINGNRPWDIVVHNDEIYKRVMQEGSLGFGEAYMDGWWDCEALDQFFYKIINEQLDQKVTFNWRVALDVLKSKLMNLQTKARSMTVGEQHYDLGNDLYQLMLDKNMIYSCAYWQDASTLDQAQENKLDLICKKLQLKPGMKLLDIGCGWGGLARYAAEHYGAHVTGVTISKEQAHFAQEFCKGLPVTILVRDYRDVHDTFDRIVSVGMFEHVGYKNYREFMELVHRCLKDNGLFLLHTIGGNASVTSGDLWITKYIFPNSMLPSLQQISAASEGLFIMEDWHNFGNEYDRTLMNWYERFNKNWHQLKATYGERFYRMWKYYLLSCAGLFRARKAQLWQVVFSKRGVPGGYVSIR
jgi:cyclopropane-fatty-acyl-phospholipid synthase